jgi:hypothetical protein
MGLPSSPGVFSLTLPGAYDKITRPILEAWCSGLTCGPVKAEIAGSNPVASASQCKGDTSDGVSPLIVSSLKYLGALMQHGLP